MESEKRKRGRPRKISAGVGEKRKRGQPRQTYALPDEVVNEEQPEISEEDFLDPFAEGFQDA